MEVFTYRPGEVVLTICGFAVEGWTSISVSMHSATFKQVRGIRGKNTRVRLTDTSGQVKVNLTQTAIANDVFSELVTLDKNTGTARLEVVVKDTAGTSLFSSTTAYLEGFAESSFSASQSERSWTILCDKMDSFFIGGNAEQGVDFGSILSRLGI